MAESKKPKLRDVDLIDYKETQAAVKILNESGLLGEDKIKAVATPKAKMVEQFVQKMKQAVTDGKEEELPQECVDFYNKIHSDPTAEELEKVSKKKKPDTSKPKTEAAGGKKYVPNKWAVGFAKLLLKGGDNKKKLADKLVKSTGGNDPEAAYQVRTLSGILIQLGFAEETDDNKIQLTESASELISKK